MRKNILKIFNEDKINDFIKIFELPLDKIVFVAFKNFKNTGMV